MVLVMLTHHGAHGKLKLFHLEDGGFNHQRDYKEPILSKLRFPRQHFIYMLSVYMGFFRYFSYPSSCYNSFL
ncbi:MAG: hypothetical protein O7C58_01095 [Rickettsia endosymbiont of Ixodes persulcatus]|nr:hypothetical protein [Rickettsia endosymbiont of Ixodes persulcatus]